MAAKEKRAFQNGKLPAGYERVQRGNFPDTWDFHKKGNEVLSGVVQQIKTAQTKNGETRLMYVADSDGQLWSVWDSAALEGLFNDARPGDSVFIRFKGMISVKGRKQKMKDFDVGLKQKSGKRGEGVAKPERKKKRSAK